MSAADLFDGDGAARVASALSRMPTAHVRAFARAILGSSIPAGAAHAAISALPVVGYRDNAERLIEAWGQLPGVDGNGFAALLATATVVRDSERQAEVVEVVATGPASPHVNLRNTRAVIKQIVAGASKDLLLVSFAAYKVIELVTALQSAAERGVTVRMVLETSDDSTGALSVDAAQAFSALGEHVQIYGWPLARRPPGVPSLLHAKAVVADERFAFVSSANLTGSGLEHNLELGVLIRGGPVPHRIAEHFRSLMESGVLQRA